MSKDALQSLLVIPAFSPRETVSELDRHIIGQSAAKKAVAIALRNRWRRQQLDSVMQEEIHPKNILMVGPTGVGKTEIARRLAKLAQAPFLKVEATKFTEVGYVGKDVESIIRDLVEVAVHMTRDRLRQSVQAQAELAAEERVLKALVGDDASEGTIQTFRKKLREGSLDDSEIDIEVADTGNSNMPTFEIPGMPGAAMGMINLSDMMGKAMGPRLKIRKMTVSAALAQAMQEEADNMLDDEDVQHVALQLVQQNGIVFIDEIDKIATRQDVRGGDVSREGVQRDLLPLIEGTTVATKYGTVKTDHILFIASGAFHAAKPSDLLAELQGRLPIRVELRALTVEDFRRILTETDHCLLDQSKALLATENVTLNFEEAALDRLASMAFDINDRIENIGARRLHTVLEKLLEDISFTASERAGEVIVITDAFVRQKLEELVQNTDLARFIL